MSKHDKHSDKPNSPNAPVFSRADRDETDEGTFEIWFFVIFDPEKSRSFWFRYEITRLKGEAAGAGSLWAAVFRRDQPTLYGKRVVPREEVLAAVREIESSGGALNGSTGDITWSLRFDRAPAPSKRTPAFLEHLPLPTHAAHPHTEVPFRGSVDVGKEHFKIDGSYGTQAHLWGHRRPDGIRWIYANGIAGKDEPKSVLEISDVLPREGAPDVTFATLETSRVKVNTASAFARVRWTDNTIIGRAKGSKHILVARAHAAPESFASYIYRDPAGHDLYVSQSDLAHVEIEAFERAGIGRAKPLYRTTTTHAALELHQRTPIAGHRYVEWLSSAPPSVPQLAPRPPLGVDRPHVAVPADGRFDDLPKKSGRIFAAGLTYAEHVAETASSSEPVIFEKSPASWYPVDASGEGDVDYHHHRHRVAYPKATTIAKALDDVERGLGQTLLDRWNGLIPPLLDYEVELGLMLLEDVDEARLRDPAARIRAGWFLANDLTARTCQVLGEGLASQAEALAFWSCAKSFAGFCPVTAKMFVPAAPIALDDPPPLTTLTTHVRGRLRQETSTSSLAVTLRSLLQAAITRTADHKLHARDVMLTGTPSGIAFKVSPMKRAIGARIFDRFTRVEAAFGMYAARPDAFLGIGDEVTIDGGFLGSRTVVIAG